LSIRIFSASINGIDAQAIEVEVDSSPGIHSFNIVGLPDKAVQESKDRLASAIKNSGFLPPNSKNKKITINLAPADIKKEGPAYDLPIAIGYLLETGQIRFDASNRLFLGELSLDGSLRHANGVLASAILAKRMGFNEIIIPAENAGEAAVVEEIGAIGARSIGEVISHLDGTRRIAPLKAEFLGKIPNVHDNSLLFIKGQETAKRALVIAAAGGHNLLMGGAPGTGKTLLARALSEILPPLSFEEAIEVAKIYSASGLTKDSSLSFRRPFRNPHHTTSAVAMVGGGTWPKPGEISLAHRGVLFLDEFPEFPRNVLESLRQPLEDGQVTISRASGSVSLPAKFMLVAAMNPCPCGNYGDSVNACICPMTAVMNYRKKISGPLIDRIDIQVMVPRETVSSEENGTLPEKVEEIKKNITLARQIQAERFKNLPIFCNAEINHKNIDKCCKLEKSAESLLRHAINAKGLSLRSYHKIKKISRTIADLEQSEPIQQHHVAEALSLRINEKITELF